ncbi:MAG: metallophosphoesterase [Planctomycetota bacterium]
MKLFAIGDLHLSEAEEKPMGVFGEEWQDHDRKIVENWRRLVRDEDIVFVVGDISWAMRLEEARADLEIISALPGKKVVLRGNHDYWWGAISKVRQALGEGMWAIQNDCVAFEGIVLAGSRGWMIPHEESAEEDWTIYRREVERLKLSLEAAKRAGLVGRRLVVGLHYPPMVRREEPTGFTELLESYGAEVCVYGHLHGEAHGDAVVGEVRGVSYRMVSCDAVGFTPALIAAPQARDDRPPEPTDAVLD